MTKAEKTQRIAEIEKQVADGLFTPGEGRRKIAEIKRGN